MDRLAITFDDADAELCALPHARPHLMHAGGFAPVPAVAAQAGDRWPDARLVGDPWVAPDPRRVLVLLGAARSSSASRHDDTRWEAVAVLTEHVGADRVFFDHSSLPPGVDFLWVVRASIVSVRTVLVVPDPFRAGPANMAALCNLARQAPPHRRRHQHRRRLPPRRPASLSGPAAAHMTVRVRSTMPEPWGLPSGLSLGPRGRAARRGSVPAARTSALCPRV